MQLFCKRNNTPRNLLEPNWWDCSYPHITNYSIITHVVVSSLYNCRDPLSFF
jgi:hypothetical protein